jgi:5'-deoxy-5'-methylthioadenosine phosphorylase
MTGLAIIGGTGLTSLKNLEIERREVMHTPYGEPSGPLVHGKLCGHQVVFIPRHGTAHTIPPHEVNYRANLWALDHIGITKIIAVAAVGGITVAMAPQTLVIPDQIIDYTWARQHTFFQGDLARVTHIDFTHPYSSDLRALLLQAGQAADLELHDGGTYGATQGPRLETAAEIIRLERDGCDIVGMTGMPEAALARELELSYAAVAVVANWAAGRGPGEISMDDIERNLKTGMDRVRALLEQVIPIIE